MDALLQRAAEVYALVYFGLLLVVAVLEWVVPLRPVTDTLRLRWLSNIGISLVDNAIVRSLFPMVALGWAAFCRDRGWGALNQAPVPAWLAFILAFLALDLVYYALHRLMHWVPLLWRLHRTHHTDHAFDFTTGLRFHPLETVLTTAAVFAAILSIGPPTSAVLLLQLLSVGVSFVDHANVRVPPSWDRVLRVVFVTPDMHRVHHSRNAREGQSNFSNLFSWWDRLFATYVHAPAAGWDDIEYGVAGFDEHKHLSLPWMLAQPFLSESDQPSTRSPVNDVAGR